mmetsp:Transcript_21435/g.31917  ORF Transcript_21435/g.31917 Transcript_21435/m.31917 type:complete len:159 (+) Transcript_21435:414-890(+)
MPFLQAFRSFSSDITCSSMSCARFVARALAPSALSGLYGTRTIADISAIDARRRGEPRLEPRHEPLSDSKSISCLPDCGEPVPPLIFVKNDFNEGEPFVKRAITELLLLTLLWRLKLIPNRLGSQLFASNVTLLRRDSKAALLRVDCVGELFLLASDR